jgi:hypothetical protein
MMNRRGLFAAFALAPIMAVEAFAKPKPEGEPDPSQVSLVLHGNKTKPASSKVWAEAKPNSFNQNLLLCQRYYPNSWPETDPNKQVSLSVGEDGNLWLKTAHGQWKRVVTE